MPHSPSMHRRKSFRPFQRQISLSTIGKKSVILLVSRSYVPATSSWSTPRTRNTIPTVIPWLEPAAHTAASAFRTAGNAKFSVWWTADLLMNRRSHSDHFWENPWGTRFSLFVSCHYSMIHCEHFWILYFIACEWVNKSSNFLLLGFLFFNHVFMTPRLF